MFKDRTAGPVNRAALAVVVGLTMGSAALADDKIYQGGNWNNASSWAPFGVPGQFDRARLPASQSGNVSLEAGFDVEEIIFDNADNYHLQGGGLGKVRQIVNSGQFNEITLGQLTGQDFDGQDILVVTGEASIRINAQIINDPISQSPLDAYLRGELTQTAVHTGITHISNSLTLSGLGGIAGSPTISLVQTGLHLNNSGAFGPTSVRLNDSARLNFERSTMELQGDQEERIGSIGIQGGANLLFMSGGNGALSATGPGSIVRDATARGMLIVQPEDTQVDFLTGGPTGRFDDLVPWAVVAGNGIYAPARYLDGGDNIPGTADDPGFRQVDFATSFDPIIQTIDDDVDLTFGTTFSGNTQVRSLTIANGGQLNLDGGGSILINGGALVLSNAAPVAISQTLIGTVQFPAGREAFIHSAFGTHEIGARLSSANGLTIGGGGDIILSGANNLTGQVTMNGGKLTLRNPSAVPGNKIRLSDASLDIDYVTGAFASPIISAASTATPLGEQSFILDLRVRDNATVNFTGGLQGSGAFFLRGDNATFRFTSTADPDLSDPIGNLSLFALDNVAVHIEGKFGNRAMGQRNTILMFNNNTLSGTGEVSGGVQLAQGGTVAPGANGGASVGILKAQDLSFFDGRLKFQVNGTSRGATYDGVDVTDLAFFGSGGTVEIQGGFSGAVGTRLELVKAGFAFRFGTFPTIINPLGVTQSGAQWVTFVDVDSLDIAVAGPNGDADLSGSVNLDDFTRLAASFGTGGSWLEGDFNYDGQINLDDFTALAANFGASVADLPRQTGVPEPGLMLVSPLAISALLRRRGRRV